MVENMKISYRLFDISKNVILFRICLSLRCCGYNLALNEKNHTLNCSLFLQKFLLKKITNSLLVSVVAQFTAKTTNSEKAIHFLLLMSC